MYGAHAPLPLQFPGHRFPQKHTRLERHDPSAVDSKGLPCLGIAAAAWILLFDMETAEAGYFQILARVKGVFHNLEDVLQQVLGLPGGYLRKIVVNR
jgi:hypothetical protein